jgi:beta-galactosidase
MSEFRMGSSYYPEWWPEARWEEDFRKMAELGLNVVRMGEFAWSWYEPREGEYNFEPMKKAVALAGKYGIKTVMGTTTAVCPPWLYKKYPEVKGGNERGDYGFGGRKGNCLSSEIFLSYARKIVTEQAKAFGDDPNVIGWQLDNEPGYPFVCYDDRCEAGFQKWLKEKYGTIDKLNAAWFTMMFSNVYNGFDEIRLPLNAAEGGWSPAMRLDYRSYFSFIFNRLLRMETEILRKYIGDRFIYTNWPGANWSVSCEEASQYLDYSAWDNYVPTPYNDYYRYQFHSCMEHDLCRRLSNGKGRFLVAEQATEANANQLTGIIRAQTWINIAHGAFGTMFFEWRKPTGGVEQGINAVLARDGSFGEAAPEFRRLASELKAHYGKIDGAETIADVATVYSYENSWATPGWTVDGAYDQDFFNAHGGFKNALKRNLDVIFPSDDFSKYRVVVAPNLKIVSEADAERLISYVAGGGILVINTECGTRDEYNNILELIQPGLFAEIAGAQVVSSISVGEMEKEQRGTGEEIAVEFENGRKFRPIGEMIKLRLTGAEPVAVYTCGKLKGKPAVTLNSYGKGHVMMFCSSSDDPEYFEAMAYVLAERFGIKPILNVPDGVIVSSRVKDGQEYFIAVNAKESDVSFTPEIPLYDVLNDKRIEGNTIIKGYDVLFAKKL